MMMWMVVNIYSTLMKFDFSVCPLLTHRLYINRPMCVCVSLTDWYFLGTKKKIWHFGNQSLIIEFDSITKMNSNRKFFGKSRHFFLEKNEKFIHLVSWLIQYHFMILNDFDENVRCIQNVTILFYFCTLHWG